MGKSADDFFDKGFICGKRIFFTARRFRVYPFRIAHTARIEESRRFLHRFGIGAFFDESFDHFRIFFGVYDTSVAQADFEPVMTDRIVARGDIDKAVEFSSVRHDFRCGDDAGIAHDGFSCEKRSHDRRCDGSSRRASVRTAYDDGIFLSRCGADIIEKNVGGDNGERGIFRADFIRRVLFIARFCKNFAPARRGKNHIVFHTFHFIIKCFKMKCFVNMRCRSAISYTISIS